MGLGLLGRGIGDAAFLAAHGARLTVTDLKDHAALAAALAQLAAYPGITYRLGGHDLADFADGDLVLKGAGVPLDSPYIAHARKHRVPVDMSASLFARIAGIPLIGVTGTRGKSTVAHLIAAFLQAEGREVLLGGNVRGVSNLALLAEVSQSSLGVFELDSWQCQGFGEERSLDAPGVRQGPLSPDVAVFTTFYPDHLTYYHGDLGSYLKDKTHVFAHQRESDTLVVGRQALAALAPYRRGVRSQVIVADDSDVPASWDVALVGAHNRYNIGVALATARHLGVGEATLRQVVASFRALPGRLELVRTVRGVAIYNDTNATTPEATMRALQALDPVSLRRVVLIMGGTDKGLDMAPLLDILPLHAKAVVLLKGTGTGKLTFHGRGLDTATVDTLDEAVEAAWQRCDPGDTLLFSPAFASFGMFANEYDRGERFNEAVAGIRGE